MNRVGFVLLSCVLFLGSVQAQDDFPKRAVTIYIGYPPGGPTGAFAQAIAQRFSDEWKQPVIVDNRPGANETIAAQFVAKAPADGYTLLLTTEGPLTQNQFLYKKLQYDPVKDFEPVTAMIHAPMLLAVHPSFPATNLREFIAVARSRESNPINYASSGVGGINHLPMAMLGKNEKFQWTHVPFKGAAPLLPELLTGRVEATFLATSILGPYVQDKKLRGIAISGPARAKNLPDVPTFKELGVEDVGASFILALSAPKGTPPAVLEKIAASAKKAVNDPQFREKHMDPFAWVPVGSGPKEFAAYLVKDRIYQAERVKASGASLD